MSTKIDSKPSSESENSPTPSQNKLSAVDIFDKMRPLMCSVISTVGESSGFFIDKDVVLTAAHNVPIRNGKFLPDLLQIEHKETPTHPQQLPSTNEIHAKILDLYPMKTDCAIADELIPLLPDNVELKEGMKVYFAGYPLGQDTVTFHRGMISSISKIDNIREFTIDGTVVPGNSGGPVVVKYEGKPYLAGVITSEIADFSLEDQQAIAVMSALKNKYESLDKKNLPSVQFGSITLDTRGVSEKIAILTPDGQKEIEVNDRATIAQALELIQKNLSTGIGKAIDIRHYQDLTRTAPPLSRAFNDSFPVKGKGKKLYSRVLTDKAKTEIAKLLEKRYGNTGGGNRGVRIILCAPLGKENKLYKFSPNPHTAPGNYNNHQPELYDKAGIAIVNKFIADKKWPQSIDFAACKTTYIATIDE